MKDHVEIGHLTRYDAFRMNRDQVMDLEIWFKIHTNVFNFKHIELAHYDLTFRMYSTYIFKSNR